MLEAKAGCCVIGEAGDGIEAIRMLENLKPDVLIVDMMMPGLNGLEVTRQVCDRWPSINVIMLSMYTDEAYVVEALQAGAKGYIFKSCSPEEFITAIRKIAAGHRYLSPPLSDRAIEVYMKSARKTALQGSEQLTDREREIFQMAAQGCTTSQIADMLSISHRTAQTHRKNLMNKLGLHTQTELVLYAIQNGIVKPNL